MSTGVQPIKTGGAVDWQHPYPGLKSFAEADREFFRGRQSEELELFRMVKRLVLTTCFGASGLGKTSLLNAGLFPRLREALFFPISVRLDFSPASGDLTAQVMRRIAEEAEVRKVETLAPASGETLWEYFHRSQFWDSASRLLCPVLVLDQFEEIFTLGAVDARVDPLVEELADLIENRIPISQQRRFAASDDAPFSLDRQHYRVVLSLREDYLPHLEDFLPRIPALARNRFRLTAMDGFHAMEAILEPGKQNTTRRSGIGDSPRCGRAKRYRWHGGPRPALDRLRVEPSVLGLFCHELNNRRIAAGMSTITVALLKGSRDEIISDFYERCMKDRKRAVREFVENMLLTGSGFRRAEAVEEAIRLPGVTKADLDELINRRLLRTEKRLGIPHVELIHDVLKDVVMGSRDRRRHEKARRLKLLIRAAAAVGFFAIGFLAWWGTSNQKAADINKVNADAILAATARSVVPAPPPTPHVVEQNEQRAKDVCATYRLCDYDTRDKWRKAFLDHEVKSGTWHVFVMSLQSASEQQAIAAKEQFQRQFPNQDFEAMPTANTEGGNQLWAIVIAQGLDNSEIASRIAGFTRASGIEKTAFKWRQP